MCCFSSKFIDEKPRFKFVRSLCFLMFLVLQLEPWAPLLVYFVLPSKSLKLVLKSSKENHVGCRSYCSICTLVIENHRETLQKWHTCLWGNSWAICVTMWLAKVLQNCTLVPSLHFFFSKCSFHTLAAQSSKSHAISVYHEKSMLNPCNLIIQNISIQALIKLPHTYMFSCAQAH